MTEPNTPAHNRDLTRRRLLLAGGAGVVAAGIGGTAVAGAATGRTGAATGTGAAADGAAGAAEACCTLTSETTEGPYNLDYDLFRKDITEDREGIPLTLRLKVVALVSVRSR